MGGRLSYFLSDATKQSSMNQSDMSIPVDLEPQFVYEADDDEQKRSDVDSSEMEDESDGEEIEEEENDDLELDEDVEMDDEFGNDIKTVERNLQKQQKLAAAYGMGTPDESEEEDEEAAYFPV